MNGKTLRRQRLGVTSPWIIKSVELAVANKRLGIEVECPMALGRCVVGGLYLDRSRRL
jgi:hypothetical protein